jgi:HNH endonuclease
MAERTPADERFWAKVNRDGPVPKHRPDLGPCWQWTAAKMHNGYGRFKRDGRTLSAHRVAYELVIGSVPDGLELDHLCRNPACVNPAHLEPVTGKVNVLRGETITAANAAKDFCDRGHPLSGENLFVRRGGRRLCRMCKREMERKARATDSYRQKHAADERRRRAEKKEQR